MVITTLSSRHEFLEGIEAISTVKFDGILIGDA
jgi:hypothetical protein